MARRATVSLLFLVVSLLVVSLWPVCRELAAAVEQIKHAGHVYLWLEAEDPSAFTGKGGRWQQERVVRDESASAGAYYSGFKGSCFFPYVPSDPFYFWVRLRLKEPKLIKIRIYRTGIPPHPPYIDADVEVEKAGEWVWIRFPDPIPKIASYQDFYLFPEDIDVDCYLLTTDKDYLPSGKRKEGSIALNLVQNPGFESGEVGWRKDIRRGKFEFEIDSSNSYSGRNSAKLHAVVEGWARWIQGNIYLEKGKVYTASVYVKGSGRPSLWIHGDPCSEKKYIQATDDEWQKLSFDFVAQRTGLVTVMLQLNSGTVWFDDVEIRERSRADKIQTFTYGDKIFLYKPRYEKEDNPLEEDVEKLYKDRGFVVYLREDPRYIYPESIPQPGEIKEGIETFATPGQYAPLWFIVYSLKDLKGIDVKLKGDLISESGDIIRREDVKIKLIKFWSQRRGWAGTTYYVIPELLEDLEDNSKVDIPKGRSQGFWLHIKVPEKIEAGDYKGKILIMPSSAPVGELTLNLKVLPFKLERPEGIHWIMYCDDSRWNSMSDSEMRRDLLDMKEYGISGFILELYSKGGWTLIQEEDGNIGFYSQRLVRFQKIRKELGIKGPLIVAGEKYLESSTGRILGIEISGRSPDLSGHLEDKGLKEAFKKVLKTIDSLIKRTGGRDYSDWYYYGTDEPFAGFMPKALWEYRLAKEAGVRTVCTLYPRKELLELLPYLDVDITTQDDNKEQNQQRHVDLKKMGCQYWYLGAGCYLGQEGGLMPNRYKAGFLFYKTGASAHVSWTYQRPVESPWTDFDEIPNAPFGEQKDACITYPAYNLSAERVSISTLQWEGIREGIDDYRYIYTLRQWIKRAESNGYKEEAESARKRLQDIVEDVPWEDSYKLGNCYNQPGNFTNGKADKYRWLIATEIMKLKDLLNKDKKISSKQKTLRAETSSQ